MKNTTDNTTDTSEIKTAKRENTKKLRKIIILLLFKILFPP
ncbi:hypothetical protein BSG1_04220 [Bacillus sp. SG-1]|nr:hypothetical protein BSG1_12776 [Bacillus sp. SG-1]EDL66530.1 hypothetical protein BSG1_04220 [Bacillus sp. SG-1]